MMYGSGGSEADLDDTLSGGLDYDDPAPNLEVIYQAFGERADLYRDVLQVKSSATAEQIQMAYFDRRSELFALLASIDSEEEQDDITASHRFHAERKMDAVVMAVRILGDPQLRQEYDNVMVLQQTKKQPREPPSSTSVTSRGSSSREPDGVYAGVAQTAQDPPSPRAPRSPKQRSGKLRPLRHVSPPDNDASDDNAKTLSSDEMLMHQHFQHHPDDEPNFEFVAHSLGSKGSKSSTSNKGQDKHKKGHKKKRHQDHHHHHHINHSLVYPQHNNIIDPSFDQSTLGRAEDDETFQEATIDSVPTYQADSTLDRTWDDQGTVASGSTAGDWTRDSSRRQVARGGTSTLSNITHGGFVSRIQEEVAGTVEDTLVSFEQVLNVFTLQERDIQAVMGRIDKAKRQLRKRR
jgi:hypothetical protein